jgi:hypothetical protein
MEGKRLTFPPTITHNGETLMNGPKTIAVISKNGSHIPEVPSDWIPGQSSNG